MPLRAVIFDFDGVILDTEVPEFATWCEVYEAHGCALEVETWSRGIGTRGGFDPYLHLERLSGAAIDREAIRQSRRAAYQALRESLQLLEGVEDRIAEAKSLGIKVAIASSSDRAWIDEHLEPFGLLSAFDSIRCAGEGLPAKPDPALYRAVLDDLGCEPSEAVAFEDSPNGVAAAKMAGVYCIAIPNSMTAPLDLTAADALVASLSEVSLAAIGLAATGRRPDSAGSPT